MLVVVTHLWSLILQEAKYDEVRKNGQRRLSLRATKAALMISLYRDEPAFQTPYEIIRYLEEVDENMTKW